MHRNSLKLSLRLQVQKSSQPEKRPPKLQQLLQLRREPKAKPLKSLKRKSQTPFSKRDLLISSTLSSQTKTLLKPQSVHVLPLL
jgi:hypothetical protein